MCVRAGLTGSSLLLWAPGRERSFGHGQEILLPREWRRADSGWDPAAGEGQSGSGRGTGTRLLVEEISGFAVALSGKGKMDCLKKWLRLLNASLYVPVYVRVHLLLLLHHLVDFLKSSGQIGERCV